MMILRDPQLNIFFIKASICCHIYQTCFVLGVMYAHGSTGKYQNRAMPANITHWAQKYQYSCDSSEISAILDSLHVSGRFVLGLFHFLISYTWIINFFYLTNAWQIVDLMELNCRNTFWTLLTIAPFWKSSTAIWLSHTHPSHYKIIMWRMYWC